MDIEWDGAKADSNLRKHRISFYEAATVFFDPLALSDQDPDHSQAEDRYITFGYSNLDRLIAVSHTYRPGAIRIVSARRVSRGERKLYEEGER